jgi:hypothetical protein
MRVEHWTTPLNVAMPLLTLRAGALSVIAAALTVAVLQVRVALPATVMLVEPGLLMRRPLASRSIVVPAPT